MPIERSNCKPAVCCLLAATLLSACGGGSSSSTGAGGTDSRTYQQGYAAGTAATLGIVLDDLRALQMTLAGDGAPAQTSRGALGRSFASLEPRQRETLAASLLTFIARVEAARAAAAAPTAGQAEAEAAQAAADDALRALQLVITADTADRTGGDEQVQMAAINALNQITRVDVTDPDARDQVDEALDNALRAARTEVADLERQLAAAQAAAAQAGQAAGTAAETITRLQSSLTVARNNLDDLTVEFGDGSAPRRTVAAVRFEPRMTGMTITPAGDYDPYAGWKADLWTAAATSSAAYREVSESFREGSGRIELEPSPVLYSASAKSVVSSDPHTGHFPARGLAIREGAAALPATGLNSDGYDGTPLHRLRIQGRRLKRSTDGNNTPRWGNWNATAYTTFRYDPTNGLTMGFGGDGVIYSDLEQYVAKGGDCQYIGGSSSPMEPCDDAVSGDIEISFGAPSGRDPVVAAGEPGTYYWRVQGEDPLILTAANEADPAVKAKQAAAYADYELVLSNYAGKKDAASAHRFLRHAAYGLFLFTDNIYFVTGPIPARTQVFHYGKNAFGTGRQVSGVADEITAKFEGRTHGYMLHGRNHQGVPKTASVTLAARHTRVRGDVKLTANIGGSSPTNTVTGTIENLEHAVGVTGRWTDEPSHHWWAREWDHDGDANTATVTLHSVMKGTINLSANVDADGAFDGTATPGDFIDDRDRGTGGNPPGVWGAGEFEGALYGPLNNLEAAGTWWVPATGFLGAEAMVGSFGAVCTESSNGGAGACAAPASP